MYVHKKSHRKDVVENVRQCEERNLQRLPPVGFEPVGHFLYQTKDCEKSLKDENDSEESGVSQNMSNLLWNQSSKLFLSRGL